MLLKFQTWEPPGSPMVRTSHAHCRGHRFHPGWVTKILHAAQGSKKKKMVVQDIKIV